MNTFRRHWFTPIALSIIVLAVTETASQRSASAFSLVPSAPESSTNAKMQTANISQVCSTTQGCYQAAPVPLADFPSDLANKIVSDAAQKAGVPVSSIHIVEAGKVTWSNGCMGVYAPDRACTMALVDGWAVLLASDTQVWLYSASDYGRFTQVKPINITTLPGLTQENPILPDRTEADRFIFSNVRTGQWSDPPMTPGFKYQMLSDSLFTQLLNFPVGIDGDGLFTVSVGDRVLGQFQSGQSVDFVSLFGAGVSEFTITGIDPLVDATDPVAFPIQLAFDTETADFSMTAVDGSSASVPEPSSVIGLILAGATGYQVRRGRRVAIKSK